MIPTHSLWDAHMFLDSNMCFHLNCWNVYMALQRVINISKSSKNEGPLWPHTLCFDSGFKMSESHKAQQAAFYIALQVKEELKKRKKRKKKSFHRLRLSVPPQPTQGKSAICLLFSSPCGKPAPAKSRVFWIAQVLSTSWTWTNVRQCQGRRIQTQYINFNSMSLKSRGGKLWSGTCYLASTALLNFENLNPFKKGRPNKEGTSSYRIVHLTLHYELSDVICRPNVWSMNAAWILPHLSLFPFCFFT